MQFAVIDVEVTSIDKAVGRVYEIAVVQADLEHGITGQVTTLLRAEPAFDALPAAFDRAPTFTQAAGRLLEAMNGRVLVGHNAAFDRDMIGAELFRAGLHVGWFDARWVDTLDLARQAGIRKRKLSQLVWELVGKDASTGTSAPWHTAPFDAVQTWRVLTALVERGSELQALPPFECVLPPVGDVPLVGRDSTGLPPKTSIVPGLALSDEDSETWMPAGSATQLQNPALQLDMVAWEAEYQTSGTDAAMELYGNERQRYMDAAVRGRQKAVAEHILALPDDLQITEASGLGRLLSLHESYGKRFGDEDLTTLPDGVAEVPVSANTFVEAVNALVDVATALREASSTVSADVLTVALVGRLRALASGRNCQPHLVAVLPRLVGPVGQLAQGGSSTTRFAWEQFGEDQCGSDDERFGYVIDRLEGVHGRWWASRLPELAETTGRVDEAIAALEDAGWAKPAPLTVRMALLALHRRAGAVDIAEIRASV